jgi:predicted nuclease of restriction endonuclease-like RecB superfamily
MGNPFIFLVIAGIIFLLILILIYFGIKKYKNKSKFNKKTEKISTFRCLDGHLVKSKGELIIDNYLFFLGIQHIYEKVISLRGNKVKCDWYLPKYDIYIEYWGYYGKRYNKRKKEKLRLYQKENIKIISTNINKMLKKYIKNYKENYWKAEKKYCYNCGKELDERF